MSEPTSERHLVDLKMPLGGLLAFCGALLALYGLFTAPEVYEKSMGININLIWGLVMLVAGGFFLAAHFFKKTDAAKR